MARDMHHMKPHLVPLLVFVLTCGEEIFELDAAMVELEKVRGEIGASANQGRILFGCEGSITR
ncbi:hypothetical protein Csa_000054 [Cucumis sativus]|uniref:Uncharacterized protein n=1 Tax=Cucumis sativus TaxID=3659 RepID=A0A0A0KPC2_CUCSA|nr:hypothetical protein Csa_000054 [Cucumis sativus]